MKYNKYIRAWLIFGCVLLFFQIIIGGITRITGSGLSITKWEIVTGTLPPLNETDWNKEFDLYKETPQYEKINQGMSLTKFKFIYFWEYFHRLWARLMGFAFLFPFLFFLYKGWLDKDIIRRLSYVILSAALAATFGWIMVASGLIERPWVNAYKLSLHLGIALMTLGFLLWVTFHSFKDKDTFISNNYFSGFTKKLFILLCIQIFFGAIVSGMRAALYYPTWPDIGGEMIPSLLFDSSNWSLESIVNYDTDVLMPALIHLIHRTLGYIVYFVGLFYAYKIFKYPLKSWIYKLNIAWVVCLNLQVVLGILVLINSRESIPVFFGVMHQAIAIFIFSLGLFNLYIFRKRAIDESEVNY